MLTKSYTKNVAMFILWKIVRQKVLLDIEKLIFIVIKFSVHIKIVKL